MRARFAIQLSIVAVAAMAALVPLRAELVERWFTGRLYPAIQGLLTPTSNLLPIAWLDLLVLSAVIWFGWLWYRAFRPREKRLSRSRSIGLAAWNTLVAAACVYLVFLGLWGLNYERVRLPQRLVLERDTPTTEQVFDLGLEAARQVNALYAPAHSAGWSQPTWQHASLRDSAVGIQQMLGAARNAVPGRLKQSVFGLVFRWNGVDGMINPFGLEVLANPDLLPFEKPFVAAHEWAHLAGYADESEANFVGWLTCLHADVPSQYSGWLFLYWQVAGELDGDGRAKISQTLASGPRADLEAIADRLRRGSLPLFQRVSWAAYDKYLKANRVKAGIRSYGEVVTLILRARFEDGWRPVRRGPGGPTE